MLASFDKINKLSAPRVEDFEILDWKLIEFIGRREDVTKEEVLRRFGGEKACLIRLSRVRSLVSVRDEGAQEARYYLTDFGRKLLQDYKARNQLDFRNRLVSPVTVSVLTNALIHGIVWLWPHLQRFLANVPVQTP